MASDQTVSLELRGDATDLKKALDDSAKAMDDLAGTGSKVGADIDKVLRGIGESGSAVDQTIRGIDARLDTLTGTDRQVFLEANIGQAEAALRQIDQMLTDPTLTDVEISLTLDERNQVSAQIDKLKGDLGELEESVQDVGEEGKRSFGALAGAIGSAGAAAAIDSAVTASGRLQAQLGLTADEAREFDAIAKTVYRDNFGDSMGDAAQVTGQVHQALGLVGDDLLATTEGVFSIRDAFEHLGADADTTLNAVRTMRANFPGMDEAEVLDLIAGGFQTGAGRAGDLIDVLQEYPGDFSRIGLSADDMVGIINSGLEAGAWNADRVGDAVREMGIRITTAGDTGQDAIRAMFPPEEAERLITDFGRGGDAGRTAFFTIMEGLAEVEDPAERFNLSVELMGTLGEELANQFPTMAEGLREVADGTADAGSGVEGLNSQYDGFRNTLDGLLRSLETSVVGTLGDVGLGFADVAANAGIALLGFKGMSDALPGMTGRLRGAAIGLGAIAGTVGAIFLVKEGLDALGLSARGLEVDVTAAARATTEELVEGFQRLNDFDSGAGLEMFAELAEGNIGTAERLRDGLAEVGVETEELDAILGDAAAAERQMAEDSQAAGEVLGEFGEDIDTTAEQVDNLTDSIDSYDAALRNHLDPLWAAQDALMGHADAQDDAKAAALELLAAQEELDDAIRKHGPTSDQARDATNNLSQAQRRHEDANRDVVRSAMDVSSATQRLAQMMETGRVSIGEAEEQLRAWVAQGVITEEQAYQVAEELRGTAGAADALDGRNVVTSVQLSGYEQVIARLDELARRAGTPLIYNASIRAREAAVNRESGGIVPGALGEMVPVNAHGMEYVIRAPAAQAIGYDNLERLNRADQQPAAFMPAPVYAGAGGGGTTRSFEQRNTIVVRDPREAVAELSAAHRRKQLAGM